ncbi:MAG: NADH-quinone oxidoreductase subunit NuoB [Gammaproteobacteria bacterium]|nr:NADH-quinone oxidoreductase subunit NuoB [Gammaproteobacteria bacterium]
MLRILGKIQRVGIITESLSPWDEPALGEVGAQLKAAVGERFRGSLAIRQLDAGSCNGCELEIHALDNPYYGIERFGVHFVASPRHADLLLVTGPVSRHMEEAVRRVYAAAPDPKLVIAVGDCGASGGEFGVNYACAGAVSNVIPVDAVIAGCPPTPLALMQGILEAIGDPRSRAAAASP